MRLLLLLIAVLSARALLLPDQAGAMESPPASVPRPLPTAQPTVSAPAGMPPASASMGGAVLVDPLPPGAGAEPPTELSRELMFHVLAGQIAGQRGQHLVAFKHFVEAAQQARNPALAEKAARAALASGDEEAMAQGLALWLDIAPEALAAHQLAAFVRLQRDDLEGAMVHLRRLVNLSAEEGESGFVQLARLVHKLRPPGQRMEVMELLTQGEPENADAWFARALVAAGTERNDEAVEAARRATELRPEWTEPRLFLVQLLKDLGRLAEARVALERFVAEQPRDQGLQTLYAQFLVDDKELERAREVFAALLVESPREPDILFALGILSLQLEDLAAGRDYFTRLRETEERRDDAAYYLGRVEELAGQPETASRWYDKVRGVHALDARIRLTRLEAQGGDLTKARERLRQLRDQNRKQAVLLYLVEAELLTEMGLNPEAMGVYDAALAAYPDDRELLYARGLHGAAMQRLEVVERDLRRLLELEPDHADALNALGYSLADMSDRSAVALELIQRALALKPDEGAILDSMGWVQYRLGKLELALNYLRQASAKLPDDPEVAAHLGEVLWALGQRDEARQVWDQARAAAPGHAYLLRVIGRHPLPPNGTQP